MIINNYLGLSVLRVQDLLLLLNHVLLYDLIHFLHVWVVLVEVSAWIDIHL